MSTTIHKQEKGFKTLKLDIDYYQSFLDDPELSDDEKREFIETLWAIVVQFVDMGYGIEATQLALTSHNLPIDEAFRQSNEITGRNGGLEATEVVELGQLTKETKEEMT